MLIAILIPLVMALLQVSAVNTLLPAIQETLGATSSGIQWVLAGYALVYGIILVPAGRIGDLVGRSMMFVIGLAIFSAGCLACALATDTVMLNAMRILQAVGAGVFSPQVNGMIQQYFDRRARAKAFGLMGLTISASVAAGPLISGATVAIFGNDPGWRYAFAINTPIGLLGLFLAFRWLAFSKERRTIGPNRKKAREEYRRREIVAGRPASKKRGRTLDLDPVGMITLCIGVFLIMMPFTMHASWRMWLLPAAVLVLTAWVWWEYTYERRGHIPMVNLKLFKISSFSYCTAISALQFLGSTSIFVLIALFVQQGLGQTALFTGLIGLPNAVISAYFAVFASRHAIEKGRVLQVVALLIVIGSVLATVAVAYGVANLGWHPAWLTLPIAPVGIGLGMMGSVNQTQSMLEVPAAHGGTAGGMVQTAQRITTAIGNAVVTAVFFASGAAVGHTPSEWFRGFASAQALVVGFISLAVIVAVVYMVRGRRSIPGTSQAQRTIRNR